jgi:hypothetical protein
MAKKCTAQQIIDSYSRSVITEGKRPNSIFAFMDENKWKESEFYAHFSSFDHLEEEIFLHFFEHTYKMISKDSAYENFDAKNKLLTFYYTFFEILTANRSFVVFALDESSDRMKNINKLKKLRHRFKMYIHSLDIETVDFPMEMVEKIKEKGLQEAAWVQLLIAIKFWLDDHSPNFDKTDVYIEKSIQATFDVLQTPPLQSVVDLGKFLFHEKIQTNL